MVNNDEIIINVYLTVLYLLGLIVPLCMSNIINYCTQVSCLLLEQYTWIISNVFETQTFKLHRDKTS